jgi:hypothetical protein
MKNFDPILERAYQLINEPIDPNHKVPVEIAEIVDYKEAAPGEDVYAYASPDTDRPQTVISIYTNGELVYSKITLEEPALLTFGGLQSKLETVLLDEILNSKDQSSLAHKKHAIIRQLDAAEGRMILDLCQAEASQEISKGSAEDLLDVIIRMKQLISNYSTDYILLVANDVMDAIETYEKSNVTNFNFRLPLKDILADLGITKIVKVLGKDNTTPVLADGKAILVGRNSSLIDSKPLILARRKFSQEIASNSGASEGAVRLVDIVKLPVHNDSGVPILGYSVIGYESLSANLVNFRAVAYSTDIIA